MIVQQVSCPVYKSDYFKLYMPLFGSLCSIRSSRRWLHLLLAVCIVLPWLAWFFLPTLAPDVYAWVKNQLGSSAMAWPLQPLLLVLALLVYPCLEEFVFRKQLQVWLEKQLFRRFMPTSHTPAASHWGLALLANLVASVLFALSHWPMQGFIVALAVFVPSLALGSLFTGYRSLTLNTAMHSYWNLLFLFFSRQ